MEEIWKDIKGYEELYQVSNLGNVKSVRKKLKPYKREKNSKYLRVSLTKNKKTKKFYIHRLVAEVFLEFDINSKLQIDHIDNNTYNNNINNLQILTQKDNVRKQMKNMKKNIEKYKQNRIKYIILGSFKND